MFLKMQWQPFLKVRVREMNSHFIPAVTGQLEENTVVFFAIISPSFLFIYLFQHEIWCEIAEQK